MVESSGGDGEWEHDLITGSGGHGNIDIIGCGDGEGGETYKTLDDPMGTSTLSRGSRDFLFV